MEGIWIFVWILLLGVTVAIAAVVTRFTADRPSRSRLVRSRWLWLGAGLVVGGILSVFSGFGAAWTASLHGQSETPGMVLFFTGLVAVISGAGVLVGRAIRCVRAEQRGRTPPVANRRVRQLVSWGLVTFLGGHTCLIVYLGDAVNGLTRALMLALLFPLLMVASWILGFLALRAAGRPRTAVVFLLASPWPILGLHLLAFEFWESPGAYLAALALVGVVARVTLWPRFRPGAIRSTVS